MKTLDNWFKKQQHKQAKFASLYDIMFEGDKTSYFRFRLRLFNFQLLFKFLLHAAFFYFAFHGLSQRAFSLIIAATAFKMILTAGWWGALETMRTQVRYAYRSSAHTEIDEIIGQWLTLSFMVSGLAMVGTIYMAFQGYQNFPSKQAESYFFISAILFALAIQLPMIGYHSGIYSITRIMRPGISMILSQLIGVCLLLLLWPFLKLLAVPFTIIVESIISCVLSYYYTRRMYDLYNVTPLRPTFESFYKHFCKFQWLHSFVAGIANIVICSDAILLLFFYALAYADVKMQPLLFCLYLISPLIKATSNWAMLFYFDRKRLENTEMMKFIDQYDRDVSRISALVGLGLWGVALLACFVLISAKSAAYCCLLFPFFLLRAKIADQQIKAFSRYHYFDVIVSGLLLVSSIVLVYIIDTSMLAKGVFMAILILFVQRYLQHNRLLLFKRIDFIKPSINFYSWLSELTRVQGAVEVYQLVLSDRTNLTQRASLFREIKDSFLGSEGQLCQCLDHPIFFRPHLPQRPMATTSRFAVQGSGFVKKMEINIIDFETLSLKNSPILSPYTDFAFSGPSDDQTVIDHFLQRFPEGIYYNPTRNLGPRAKPICKEYVRKFPFLINQYLSKKNHENRSEIDLSVLFNEGLIQIIFVIPNKRRYKFNDIRQWHDYLEAINIQRGLYLT